MEEDGSPEVERIGAEEEETEPVTSGGGRWGPMERPLPTFEQPAAGVA
jgi:hypothetical protein